MNISQGSLVIVGANTPGCQVFWNGQEVRGVVALHIDMETDEQRADSPEQHRRRHLNPAG